MIEVDDIGLRWRRAEAFLDERGRRLLAANEALAHLYRGELYRSTVWRTRLDATTNWAVVSTGLALSLTFGSEIASPLPLVLARKSHSG